MQDSPKTTEQKNTSSNTFEFYQSNNLKAVRDALNSSDGKVTDSNLMKWWVESNISINGQEPIMHAVSNGTRIGDDKPILYCIKNTISINSLRPIYWYEQNMDNADLKGKLPEIHEVIRTVVDNNITIESEKLIFM